MTEAEFEAEYDRLFGWRARWTRLAHTAHKSERHGRLQTRQEAIERRAVIANNKITALFRKWDAQTHTPDETDALASPLTCG